MTEQPATTAPDEPLDYIGTEPPPVGYVRLGWACPRDEALRCSGCDETDATPDMCGSGHPAYRSQKWIAYAGRPLPFPSAPASMSDRSTMQPALYEAANAACIYQYTDGFCVTRNSPTCERCWGNAWRVMDATGLSARATAWLFQHGPVVERLATMPAGKTDG